MPRRRKKGAPVGGDQPDRCVAPSLADDETLIELAREHLAQAGSLLRQVAPDGEENVSTAISRIGAAGRYLNRVVASSHGGDR